MSHQVVNVLYDLGALRGQNNSRRHWVHMPQIGYLVKHHKLLWTLDKNIVGLGLLQFLVYLSKGLILLLYNVL